MHEIAETDRVDPGGPGDTRRAHRGTAPGVRTRARPQRPPGGRRVLIAVALILAAFGALALAVHAGALTGADRFADRNLAPLQHGPQRSHPFLLTWLNAPATAAISLVAPIASVLLMSAGCALLAYRGRTRRALVWVAALAMALAVEVAGKQLVDQSAIGSQLIPGDIASFPSGHAMRAILLAGLASELWPRWSARFFGVAAIALLGLQLKGAHPPSDIVGGMLIGAAILIAIPSARARRRSRARLGQNPA